MLTLRLSYLQIVQADRLASLALEQRLRPVPLLAQRGVDLRSKHEYARGQHELRSGLCDPYRSGRS